MYARPQAIGHCVVASELCIVSSELYMSARHDCVLRMVLPKAQVTA